MYDKFGEHPWLKRRDANTLEATVNVRIAPTFFGWLFQFGTEMEIISPESLKEEYTNRHRSCKSSGRNCCVRGTGKLAAFTLLLSLAEPIPVTRQICEYLGCKIDDIMDIVQDSEV